MAALARVFSPLIVGVALLQAQIVAYAGPLPAEPTFFYPYPWDRTYPITQRPGGTFSHRGNSAEAYDFAAPLGSPVAAAAAGEILVAYDGSTAGECNIKAWTRSNRVVIRHDDGTDTLYMHIASGSITRRAGRVLAGEIIAAVGMTGFTCGSHIHIQRQRGSAPAELKMDARQASFDSVLLMPLPPTARA